jgi:Bacterial extracellular solute-binding protein/Biotin-lipoyl like
MLTPWTRDGRVVANSVTIASEVSGRIVDIRVRENQSVNNSRRSRHMFIFAIMMLVALPSASPAQVRVLISGGFSAAYHELLPQFEKSTGIIVTTARGASQGDGPTTIGAQLPRGLPADVVILSRDALGELLAEGRIVIGSDVDLASVPLEVGVRAGKPRPDISTVNAFKQTLLRAKSIGIQSTSAIYLKTRCFRSSASPTPWRISSQMRERPRSPAEEWRWSFCR